jgi:HAE1 family hydrophobic/amphiphilic exporter-1
MIISHAAIRRPVTVVMTFVGLAIIGAFAAFKLPVEEFPEAESPYVNLRINYGNSSAREIEQNITRPVEEVLGTMSGVDRIFTYTRPGSMRVGIRLDMDGDINAKSIEAKELVEGIRHRLPEDVERIEISSWGNNTEESPLYNVLIVAEDLNQDEAFDVLDVNVRSRLERIPGVNSVNLYGILQNSIRITLDPSRVAAHKLDFTDIRRRLQQANFYVTAGMIDSGSREFRVRPIGQYKDLDAIKMLPLNNAGLKLQDVATVTKEPDDEVTRNRVNGAASLGVSVFKRPEANLIEVSRAVMSVMDDIKSDELFANTIFFPMDSQADSIMKSLNDLRDSGLLGGLMSVMVLFLFLRQVQVSLLIAATVPLALSATLGVMYFTGMTLNTLSLVGLMLTIGLLVDNSVVVSEAISLRRRDPGANPRDAADLGVSEVGLAIFAGTLTTVIVFIPSFMTDNIQVATTQQNVALPLCTALIGSLLVAQTLVPTVMARMPLPLVERQHPIIDGIAHYYERIVRWTLRHRLFSVLAVIAIAASGGYAYTQLTVNMNPTQESERMGMHIHVNGSPDIEYIEEYVNRLEGYIIENQERFQIDNFYLSYDTDNGNVTFNVKENSTLAINVIEDMISEGMPEQPGMRTHFTGKYRGFSRRRGPGGEGGGLSIQIAGESTEELLRIGDDLVPLLEAHPMLDNVEHDGESGSEEIRVKLNAEQAGNLGVTPAEVSQALAAALGGQNMRRGYIEDGKELSILLELEGRDEANIATLKGLPIYVEAGGTVPLENIAKITFDTSMKRIRRVNRETSIDINFELKGDGPPEMAQAIVENIASQYEFPPGYRWQLGEDFQFDADMFEEMGVNVVLAVILIYMLMAALFESVLFPTAVILAIGFSAVGACWTLLLTGTTMTSMALTGMLLLAGIVVNNGIVLLNRIIQLRNGGMDRMEAIVASGRHRLRPILMTVCTTTAGMLPLAIGEVRIGGSGPAYFPMARTLIGGLAFSTVITLIILPLIYVLFDDMKSACIGFWRESLKRAGSPS